MTKFNWKSSTLQKYMAPILNTVISPFVTNNQTMLHFIAPIEDLPISQKWNYQIFLAIDTLDVSKLIAIETISCVIFQSGDNTSRKGTHCCFDNSSKVTRPNTR